MQGECCMSPQSINETTDDLSRYRNLEIKTKTPNFKKWHASELFEKLDEEFINEVQKYCMETFNKRIDPYLHVAFMNLTDKKDTRLIPQTIMRKEVLPVFNDYDKSLFYGDKTSMISSSIHQDLLKRF